MKSVYLICPVRNCSDETRIKMDAYVKKLEDDGYRVHYPPRDVKQVDTNAHAICQAHIRAMCNGGQGVDEVHAWWDEESKGSHFDFGMAYMLNWIYGGKVKFVLANASESVNSRSYGGYYKFLTDEPEFEWKLES